jgi:hypothetical protein
MKKVKITGFTLRYKVGQVVELPEYKAATLVKAGIAEYVEGKVTQEEPSEKVVKGKK